MAAEPTDTAPAPAPALPPPVKAVASRDVFGMYPALRDDHVRLLQKWGFVSPRRSGGTQFSFQDVSVLRQVHGELQRGVPFRAALRELQANREGQLAFDFRLDAEPARIIALSKREPPVPVVRSAA